jgi:signal transduction histidine kinase
MELPDPVARLRHDIANPLAALLAEVQLALMDAEQLDEPVRRSFEEIERLAVRMRGILRESREGPTADGR